MMHNRNVEPKFYLRIALYVLRYPHTVCVRITLGQQTWCIIELETSNMDIMHFRLDRFVSCLALPDRTRVYDPAEIAEFLLGSIGGSA